MSDEKGISNLEFVVKKRIEPIIESNFQRFLGVKIEELNKDISEKLGKSPFLDFSINMNIPFKKAKRLFKKQYLRKLLRMNYGNISEVARVADVDRRSIHRIVREEHIDVQKIRTEMEKSYTIKQETISTIIEHVLDTYKDVLHPKKLEKAYHEVPELSKEIIDNLPEGQLTLKEAEEAFEKEYLRLALHDNMFNVAKTARKIGLRQETLHRKCKKFALAFETTKPIEVET